MGTHICSYCTRGHQESCGKGRSAQLDRRLVIKHQYALKTEIAALWEIRFWGDQGLGAAQMLRGDGHSLTRCGRGLGWCG